MKAMIMMISVMMLMIGSDCVGKDDDIPAVAIVVNYILHKYH
jgi:hypothetical protein